MGSLEFHQHIDITVRPEIIPQDRTEQSQPTDMVGLTEIRDLFVWDIDARAHDLSPVCIIGNPSISKRRINRLYPRDTYIVFLLFLYRNDNMKSRGETIRP